jgi:hypothetical protein
MRFILLLVTLTALFTYSCTKKKTIEYVTVSHQQTGCSDPWGAGSTDSSTLVKAGHYLDSLGLYYAALLIRADGQAEVCQACFCKTGKTIYVTTFSTLVSSYAAVGFH